MNVDANNARGDAMKSTVRWAIGRSAGEDLRWMPWHCFFAAAAVELPGVETAIRHPGLDELKIGLTRISHHLVGRNKQLEWLPELRSPA